MVRTVLSPTLIAECADHFDIAGIRLAGSSTGPEDPSIRVVHAVGPGAAVAYDTLRELPTFRISGLWGLRVREGGHEPTMVCDDQQ